MSYSFSLPVGSIVDGDGVPVPSYAQWATRVNAAANVVGQSGTTANRPTKNLWVGRVYFDTTLGHPVWYDGNGSTGWCDATGAAV